MSKKKSPQKQKGNESHPAENVALQKNEKKKILLDIIAIAISLVALGISIWSLCQQERGLTQQEQGLRQQERELKNLELQVELSTNPYLFYATTTYSIADVGGENQFDSLHAIMNRDVEPGYKIAIGNAGTSPAVDVTVEFNVDKLIIEAYTLADAAIEDMQFLDFGGALYSWYAAPEDDMVHVLAIFNHPRSYVLSIPTISSANDDCHIDIPAHIQKFIDTILQFTNFDDLDKINIDIPMVITYKDMFGKTHLNEAVLNICVSLIVDAAGRIANRPPDNLYEMTLSVH